MEFILTGPQCFFLGIIGFGLLGFIQGWRRALILMAFTLAGVLFLSLKGDQGLADIIFVKIPIVWQEVFTANPGGHVTIPSSPDKYMVFLTALVAFLVIVVAGYFVGNRAFTPSASAGSPYSRIIGIIPGLVTGYFFVRYLTSLLNSSIVSVGATTPNSSILTDNVPLLFLVGVVVIIIGLITARARKSSAKKP
jgi:hypothetical protein